ncbi:MAG: dienelactone hydrolase family protein [Myxococcota bacterium]|nr:dienelactone hydrolase family protein [Myxococcota bacterium]
MPDGTEIQIPGAGVPLPGYLARPATGRGAGVLVLHEAWGLVDQIRGVCDRLARAGFTALAPDLFRGRTAASADEAVALSASLRPDGLRGDVDRSIAALLADETLDSLRLGAVGFCLGGHLALLAGAWSHRVSAIVDFYGLHPALPVAYDRIEAAVLGIFAEADEYIPAENVDRLRADLEAAGVRSHLRVEAGVRHGFMNEARPERHDAKAADAGWDRMLAFLRAELA